MKNIFTTTTTTTTTTPSSQTFNPSPPSKKLLQPKPPRLLHSSLQPPPQRLGSTKLRQQQSSKTRHTTRQPLIAFSVPLNDKLQSLTTTNRQAITRGDEFQQPPHFLLALVAAGGRVPPLVNDVPELPDGRVVCVVAERVIVGFVFGDGFEFGGGDDGVAFDEEFEAPIGEEVVRFRGEATVKPFDKGGELRSDGYIGEMVNVVADELMAVGVRDHWGGVAGSSGNRGGTGGGGVLVFGFWNNREILIVTRLSAG